MAVKDTAEFIDGIVTSELGMNSGELPFLLPRNQLSFSLNCAVRGGFVTHRPVFQIVSLDYSANPVIQTAVENGLWQDACYYKPDFGTEQISVEIGGRLFQFTPQIAGYAATVREVTIPGDPDSSSQSIAWMWQSERWMILNDGINLPVFFDGTSSRRSMGPAHSIGITSAAFTIPAVNLTVPVTLTAPYTGPINIPVTVLGNRYNLVPNAGSFNAKLTKLYDTVATVPSGTQVFIIPSQVGVLLANYPGFVGTQLLSTSFPAGSGNTPFAPGTTNVLIGTDAFICNAVVHSGTNWALSLTPVTPPSLSHYAGELVTILTTSLNAVAGQLVSPFTVPAAVGGTVNVQLDSAYSGPAQVVWIGTGEYLIESVPAAPPSPNITLKNIGGTPAAVVAGGSQLVSLPELPAGRAGACGMGRNWESLTDGIQFVGGDIAGGPSGTPAFNYRDAVLRVTENSYLAGGGYFHVPGTVNSIRSMNFAATLDSSLGQGALQVGTPTGMFSCNAPVDRTTWAALTSPILTESLLGFGPLGQNSTIPVNSDTIFRSIIGIGSLILGRREFASWGNTPISNEMERVFSRDSTSLLAYSSSISFDNRLLMTCQPRQSGQGIFHAGIVAADYDPISNMQEKKPAVYDGLWTGLNVLQLVTGQFNGVQRAFAFNLNSTTGKIELFEILMTNAGKFDNGNSRITWSFEEATLFKDIKGKSIFDLIRLQDGEIYVDDIFGLVNFEVFYRPDNYPCWIPWHSWSVCSKTPTTAIPNAKPTYRPRMGLGTPDPKVCEPANGRTMVEGYTFQFKLVITGHCRFRGMKVRATMAAQTRFAPIVCKGTCEELDVTEDCEPCGLIDCINPDDFSVYTIQNNLVPVQPITPPFYNEAVYFPYPCDPGLTLTYSGTLPGWISLDTVNSQLVGASGQYQGINQADANSIAQAALNSFGNMAVAAGTLTCASASNVCVDGLGSISSNVYSITDYYDGLIPVTSGGMGSPNWDGTFSFFQSGKWYGGNGNIYVQGYTICIASLQLQCDEDNNPSWVLTVRGFGDLWWVGTKVGGQTPIGVYPQTAGEDTGPASVTVGQIAGTTTAGSMNCGT